MLNKSKVIGMLVGGSIGDAIGFPVETWSRDKIRSYYPLEIDGFYDPVDHKWFTSDRNDVKKTYMPKGSITDDTQLTLATLQGVLNAKKAGSVDYMSFIAKEHVKAFVEGTNGWGKTTVEAIERLKNGSSYADSGITEEKNRGTGNGIPMKCSPLVLLNLSDSKVDLKILMKDFSCMTHRTKLAIESGFIYSYLLKYIHSSKKFDILDAINSVYETWTDNKIFEEFESDGHSLKTRIDIVKRWIEDDILEQMSVEKISREFGEGSCYVYDSLPFSIACFLRKPNSSLTILDAVNAGGDTDTNAKLVGEMLGSLHGIEFFEQKNPWSIKFYSYEKVKKAALEYCNVFGIQ